MFLFWGILVAVLLVRGLLPWLIVWATIPALGFMGSFTAALSNDPEIIHAIENSAPLLLIGGGTFLLFLFFHWLFLEPKNYGLRGERFFHEQGVWFYAVVSVLLSLLVWNGIQMNPVLAFGAVIGSTAFFIVHGFRENAEKREKEFLQGRDADISKLLYLMLIDATFSIDGVLGAFAFTLSVPLILLGNGLGALVVAYITVSNVQRIKKYIFLKNGAMYSVMFLGLVMVAHSFGQEVPEWLIPVITFTVLAYFFFISKRALVQNT
jgi:hypothetical protein